MTHTDITPATLQALWNAHGLGQIQTISQPSRGVVNRCFIINESHVIRFDVLDDWGGINRYAGEKWAYATLRDSPIPVPEVVALDSSKSLAPYDYLILTKVPGRAVIDSWPDLSPEERSHIAYTAGVYLATIHGYQFDGFNLLFELAAGKSEANWAGYIADFYDTYGGNARDNGALPAETLERMERVIHRMQPLLATVARGTFVHGDYHFENVLQADGVITGVIDFEWALCGDPAWDFRIDEQLEETCPGSRDAFYAGYTSRHPLTDHHAERVAFYKLLMYLDYLVNCQYEGNQSEYDITLHRLMKQLDWLENHLPGSG
jgi:aminoglycoside phosphotransferase (APT) family kinase protein